jgi:hypothetical protein
MNAAKILMNHARSNAKCERLMRGFSWRIHNVDSALMSIHSPEDSIRLISHLYRNYTFFVATHELGFEYKRRGKRNSLPMKPRFYLVQEQLHDIDLLVCNGNISCQSLAGVAQRHQRVVWRKAFNNAEQQFKRE